MAEDARFRAECEKTLIFRQFSRLQGDDATVIPTVYTGRHAPSSSATVNSTIIPIVICMTLKQLPMARSALQEGRLSCSDEGLRNSAAQWIPANCVIVAMYGATAAKVAVNSIPLTTNQACYNLQIDETKADVRYMVHWFSNEYEHLKALGEGPQSNINAKKVKSYPISLLPLEEQRRIVSILGRFDKLTNDLSSGLPAEIEARRKQYEYYQDRLLSFDELAV